MTTLLVNEAERPRVYQLVKDELDRGRQGYVVPVTFDRLKDPEERLFFRRVMSFLM